MSEGEEIIKKFNLTSHPEGGYLREVYREDGKCALALYFLQGEEYSAFHKLDVDEVWIYLKGAGVNLYELSCDRQVVCTKLGANYELFKVVKAGVWMAAELLDKKSWALIGCLTSPPFDYSGFTLGNKEELIALFPGSEELIKKLCAEKEGI